MLNNKNILSVPEWLIFAENDVLCMQNFGFTFVDYPKNPELLNSEPINKDKAIIDCYPVKEVS